MKPRGGRGLAPLGAPARHPDRTAQAEDRLRRSWLLVVGPTLVNQTRLVRSSRGILVVGCWHPDLIPSLRLSAAAIWPQLRERLDRLWKLKFNRLEIVPCDPPEPEPPRPRPAPADPLQAVLDLLRRQGKEGWTPGRN
ncbi:MAG: DciA family protein [Holophaga sp.]|jgi:hypothetical protein